MLRSISALFLYLSNNPIPSPLLPHTTLIGSTTTGPLSARAPGKVGSISSDLSTSEVKRQIPPNSLPSTRHDLICRTLRNPEREPSCVYEGIVFFLELAFADGE